jgi:hypothetical protein
LFLTSLKLRKAPLAQTAQKLTPRCGEEPRKEIRFAALAVWCSSNPLSPYLLHLVYTTGAIFSELPTSARFIAHACSRVVHWESSDLIGLLARVCEEMHTIVLLHRHSIFLYPLVSPFLPLRQDVVG